jgi:hypothetical protein
MGWQFKALLGFHRVYSRILLAAACRKLAAQRRAKRVRSATGPSP